MSLEPIQSHAFVTDADYHLQDAQMSRAFGHRMEREETPWCKCEQDWGGYCVCRRCQRMRRPK